MVSLALKLCPPDHLSLVSSLTTRQAAYWQALPTEFRFEQVADVIVPRATLYRLLKHAKSLGVVEERDGNWRKKVCPASAGNGESVHPLR
jgi:hypothetical protein